MLRPFPLLSVLAALLVRSAVAAPIAINLSDFLTPTTITFDSIGNGVEITNQFAGLGVTFSGGLFGDTNSTDLLRFTTPGAAVAGNFSTPCSPAVPCTAITLNFSTAIIRIGMQVVTTNEDDFRIVVPGGSLDYATDLALPEEFVGLQDLNGFSTVTLLAFGTKSHAFLINDLVFDPVPEPATWGVLLIGFAAIVLAHRRRSKATA